MHCGSAISAFPFLYFTCYSLPSLFVVPPRSGGDICNWCFHSRFRHNSHGVDPLRTRGLARVVIAKLRNCIKKQIALRALPELIFSSKNRISTKYIFPPKLQISPKNGFRFPKKNIQFKTPQWNPNQNCVEYLESKHMCVCVQELIS